MIVLGLLIILSYYVGNKYTKHLLFNVMDIKQIRKNNMLFAIIGLVAGGLGFYLDNILGIMLSFVFGTMFGLIACGLIAEKEIKKDDF